MANQARGKRSASQARGGISDYPIPPLPLVVAPPDKSLGEDMIGWIAACLLAGLMLPLLAMLYLDVLETKNEAKQSIEKVEKLRRQVEQQNRKGKKDE